MIDKNTQERNNSIVEWLKSYFKLLRFSPAFHVGSGDIRLTIGMQEQVVDMIQDALSCEAKNDKKF